MQWLFSRQESRDVDRAAIKDLGIASLVLMENAGRGATDAIPLDSGTGWGGSCSSEAQGKTAGMLG